MVTRSQLGDFPSTAHSTMRCQETAAVVQQLVQPGPFFLHFLTKGISMNCFKGKTTGNHGYPQTYWGFLVKTTRFNRKSSLNSTDPAGQWTTCTVASFATVTSSPNTFDPQRFPFNSPEFSLRWMILRESWGHQNFGTLNVARYVVKSCELPVFGA